MAELENELYCGIGYAGTRDALGVTVNRIFNDTPAERAGILIGDTIIAVKEASDGRWNEMSSSTPMSDRGNTRGAAGTQIQLLISRDGANESGQRSTNTFQTDWIRREVIISDRNMGFEVDSSDECGLIGSLTPPAHINVALSEGLTPHSNQRS